MKVEVSRTHLLADLHSCMRDCRLCLEAGYEIFPRAIFSGDRGASLMVIGQAPGITEKEAGRPFNAGSGISVQVIQADFIHQARFARVGEIAVTSTNRRYADLLAGISSRNWSILNKGSLYPCACGSNCRADPS